MKRLLLLGTSFVIAISSFSQGGGLSWGTKIGQTYYDLHSNSSVADRLIRNNDGSMSATWTEHWDFLSLTNDPTGIRGFGYNHFDPASGWVHGQDGECWQADNGCASAYNGWSEIINIPGATGDKEMVFTHFRGQSVIGMSKTSRSTIGTGSWNNTITLGIDSVFDLTTNTWDLGGTWPRTVSSGNYIHMISCFAGDAVATPVVDAVDSVQNPIRYYRSSDAGQTWDMTNIVLPFDNDDILQVGGDAYAMHVNGSTVAITVGGGWDNDWLLLKSTDNGSTWTKTTIRDNHDLDTAVTGTGGGVGGITNVDNFDVVVDDAGKVHCFSGMGFASNNGGIFQVDASDYKDGGPGWQESLGILYWSEGMTEAKVVAYPDYGYDGDTADYSVVGSEFYGFVYQGWPSASFDASGNIYLLYSAAVEGTEFINTAESDTIAYYDIYMTYSLDNGATWCRTKDPINVAEDVYGQLGATPTQDDLFPSSVSEHWN